MNLSFDIEDLLELSGTFKKLDGTAQYPSTVQLLVQRPDGTVVDLSGSVVQDPAATGRMIATVRADQAGRWWHHWKSTGTPEGAEEQQFYVRRRRVPNP